MTPFFQTFQDEKLAPQLSGSRSRVTYLVTADSPDEIRRKAEDICAEQTVEFPVDLLPPGVVREQILGRVENISPCENLFSPPGMVSAHVEVSFADEVMTDELPQVLNVIFGNISIKPGIRVLSAAFSEPLLRKFPGPQFGVPGLRNLLKIPQRPILFTALKPQGLAADDLAALAYEFACGGVDVIKDDHGIANPVYAPFYDRVLACTAAVRRANAETGENAIYVPNIMGPHTEIIRRAKFAKDAGAGGYLVCPGLIGFDVIREIAQNPELSLPIFMHPAFLGSFAINPDGISHACVFGQLARLAGADATIFPNFGGRFSFSRAECLQIAEACREPMGDFPSIFPCPAGGMKVDRVEDVLGAFGKDVMLLIGGGLFSHSPNLRENCRLLRSRLV